MFTLQLETQGTFESSLGSRRMPTIFAPYVQIVESGSVSAGLPCYRVLVEMRCRFKRHNSISFKNYWVRLRPLAVFVWVELTTCLTRVFLVQRVNTTTQLFKSN